MKECSEKDFYKFFDDNRKDGFEIKESHLIKPVTLSFSRDGKRLGAIIAYDETNVKYFIGETETEE